LRIPSVKVTGDMGRMLMAILDDADLMYENDGGPLRSYGIA
jgi:hypothetical protein